MATDARGHTVPAAGETPRRQAFNDLSLTVRDVVYVANATARAQLLTDLAGVGLAASATNPVYVHRGDAPDGSRLEVTTDPTGTVWRTVGGGSFLKIRQAAAVSRSANAWTQGPVGSPTQVSATGPQPWSHSSGVITINEPGLYRIELQVSMSGSTFACAIRRGSDSRMLGQTSTGSSSSFSNQCMASEVLSAGETIFGVVYPTVALNLQADSPTTPCTLSIERR